MTSYTETSQSPLARWSFLYPGTMVPHHVRAPAIFLYRYQNCHHSCAQSVHTYKFQFLLDLCTRLKMLPGLIFLCQGCRRCLDNLPLKILSCLWSFPHQIKMAFTFYSCLISTAMMMRNAILRNNPVEGDMQKIGARWQR